MPKSHAFSREHSAASESKIAEMKLSQLQPRDFWAFDEKDSDYMEDREAETDESDASAVSTSNEVEEQQPDFEDTLRHSTRMPTSTRQADKQEGGSYYTADHIRDEKRGRVLVVWSGKDAKTGLPYEPSWVRRQDCTEQLLRDWDERKGVAKVRRRCAGQYQRTDSQASYQDNLSQSPSAKHALTPALLFKKRRPLRASSAILRGVSSSTVPGRDILGFPSDDDSAGDSGRVRKKQKRSTNPSSFEPSLSSYASALSYLQATLRGPSNSARPPSQGLSTSPASANRSRSGLRKFRLRQQKSKSKSVAQTTSPLSTSLEELVSPGRNQTAFGESIIGTFECVKLPPVPFDHHLPIITEESLRYGKPQIGRRLNWANIPLFPSSSSEPESESESGSHSRVPVHLLQPTEKLSFPTDTKYQFPPGTQSTSLVSDSELASAPAAGQFEIIGDTAPETVTGRLHPDQPVVDLSDEDSEPAREASSLDAHSEVNPIIDPLSQSQSLSKHSVTYKTTISDSDPQISDVSVRTLLKPIGEDSQSTKDSAHSQPALGLAVGEIEVPATASQYRGQSPDLSQAEPETFSFVEDSQTCNQGALQDSAPEELSRRVHFSEAVSSPVPDSQSNESAPEHIPEASARPFALVEEETLHRVEGWLSAQVPYAKMETGNIEGKHINNFDLDSFPQPSHLDTQVLNVNSNVSLNTTENSAPAVESILQGSSQEMQDVEASRAVSAEPQMAFAPTTSPHSASKAMTESLASGVARLPDNNVTDGSITLDNYRLGPAEYAVPVGLRDFQRQMYEQVLILHSSEILRFCDFGSSSKTFRDRLAQDMLKVLNRTLLAATHPYLLVPTLMPRNLSDKDESRYIVHSGEKFRILDNIITVFKETGLKLGIVAREGHTMDTVSNFLGGKRIKYARRDGAVESDAEIEEEDVNSEYEAFAKVTVIIVPSTATDKSSKKKKFSLPKVDLVVALDASFIGSESQVRQLRGVASEGDIPTVPVLRLVSVNTSEHALLGAAATLGLHESVVDTAVLSSIITAVTLLRAQAGKLPDAVVKEIDAMPEKLPGWLAGGCTTLFPVSLIASSTDNSFPADIPSTMFSVREFTPAEVDEALSALTEGSMVSELLNVLDAENQKSLNLAIETALRHILKCTRQSDGVAGGSVTLQLQQSPVKRTIAPSLLEKNGSIFSEEDLFHDHSEGSDVVMHDGDSDYHSEADLDALTIDEKEEMIKKLSEEKLSTELALQSKESELAHYKEHHSKLLIKYENADNMMNQLIATNEELEARVKTGERRIERSEAEKARLREMIAEVKVKLQIAEQTLLVGSADVIELQQLRTKVAQLEDENKKLSDKLHNRTTETEYMRAEYQKASTAAAEAALELKAVHEANEELKRKVNGEIVRLKEMQWDSERAQKDDMIKELNLRIENLENSVKRLQLDRQGTRGRYGVRSSSVPRRGLSPATRSRASSPATTGNATPTSAPASAHPLQNVLGA
ncbi:class II histone deacetylase complex subunits 2 and 3-domain-containing protein [Lipomyces doorenjongii]